MLCVSAPIVVCVCLCAVCVCVCVRHRLRLCRSLNTHGSAGIYGTVTPQPIDLVFTAFPPKCNLTSPNCTSTLAYNQETTLYALPPWAALANAWTGMHEFVRDIVPPLVANPATAVAMASILTAVCALFGTAFHNDWPWVYPPGQQTLGWIVLVARLLFAAVPCAAAVAGIVLWAYVYYPACLMHLFACASAGVLVSVLVTSSPTPPLVSLLYHHVASRPRGHAAAPAVLYAPVHPL